LGGDEQVSRRCQKVEKRNEEVQIDSAMKVLATEFLSHRAHRGHRGYLFPKVD
jgi:hypothetical protein